MPLYHSHTLLSYNNEGYGALRVHLFFLPFCQTPLASQQFCCHYVPSPSCLLTLRMRFCHPLSLYHGNATLPISDIKNTGNHE